MNFERLKSLVDKLVHNEHVKEILTKSRTAGREDASQITKTLLKALAGVTFVVGIIGGRTARRIEAVVFLIALLVELSLAFKQNVIDDPELQKNGARGVDRNWSAKVLLSTCWHVHLSIARWQSFKRRPAELRFEGLALRLDALEFGPLDEQIAVDL